jgi:hypothetical protein
LRKADAGFLHGLAHDAVEQVDMGARRDLGHHTAETGVLIGLRAHDIGQYPAAAVAGALDHGGRGLVAGGLDPENQICRRRRRVVIQFEPLRYRPKQRFRNPVILRRLDAQSQAKADIFLVETSRHGRSRDAPAPGR